MPGDNTIDVGAMTEIVKDFCYDRNCLPEHLYKLELLALCLIAPEA